MVFIKGMIFENRRCRAKIADYWRGGLLKSSATKSPHEKTKQTQADLKIPAGVIPHTISWAVSPMDTNMRQPKR
jgi:hypothetical protein